MSHQPAAYLTHAKLLDTGDPEEDEACVATLEAHMGDECAHAVSSFVAVQKSSYAVYKQALRAKFLTEQSNSHIKTLLRQCVMQPDETTKQFVARLWALVVCLYLTILKSGVNVRYSRASGRTTRTKKFDFCS